MKHNKTQPSVNVYLMSTQTFLLIAVLGVCTAYACRNESKADASAVTPAYTNYQPATYQEPIKTVVQDRPTVQQTGNQPHATLFSVTKEVVLFTWDYIF